MKKKLEKYQCYRNPILFSEITCVKNECPWFLPCKILCGHNINVFEYELAKRCFDLELNFTETLEVLGKNYSISLNAAKLGILRYYKNAGINS